MNTLKKTALFKTYISYCSEVEAVQFTEENKQDILDNVEGYKKVIYPNPKTKRPVLLLSDAFKELIMVSLDDWVIKEKETTAYYTMTNKVFMERFTEKSK